MSGTLKKGNYKATLSIDSEVYSNYREFCKREGLVISKQVERFMKKHSASKKERTVLDSILGK